MSFPTFDGGKDRGIYRILSSAINDDFGCRTRIVQNADGSTTMLRTRGGAHEVTTVHPPAKAPEIVSNDFIETSFNDRVYSDYLLTRLPAPYNTYALVRTIRRVTMKQGDVTHHFNYHNGYVVGTGILDIMPSEEDEDL